jgi:hypothetical protein
LNCARSVYQLLQNRRARCECQTTQHDLVPAHRRRVCLLRFDHLGEFAITASHRGKLVQKPKNYRNETGPLQTLAK